MKYQYVKDYNGLARRAASMICAQVLLKPKSVLGLATGSTPLGVYAQIIEAFTKGDVSFKDVQTVNLDEYCGLEATSEDSYRYYMEHNLFRHIDVKPGNTYLPDGMAEDTGIECARYTKLISELGGIDLQLLGIGHNGHIGFNEPAQAFVMDTHCVKLTKSTREANAVHFKNGMQDMPVAALTMGMRHIMQAKRIVLIAGADKSDILRIALEGPVTPEVPASILQLHPDLNVICVA